MIIIIESSDRLIRETWGFWLNERSYRINLLQYKREERRTSRCKYKTIKCFGYSHILGIPDMERNDVPLPDSVRDAIKQRVIDKLEVCK